MKKRKKKITKFCGFLIIVLVIACLIGLCYLVNELMKKSQHDIEADNFLVLDTTSEAVFEAGMELSYNDNSLAEVRDIPVELRKYIISYPEGAHLVCSEVDLNTLGEQEIVLGSILEDQFGQKSYAYRPLMIYVQDTIDPVITLQYESVVCDGTIKSIKDNVLAVTDDVYGEYHFSQQHENHSWWLDTHWTDFTKKGKYIATVKVNDNGRIFEKDFEFVIEKNRTSVYR